MAKDKVKISLIHTQGLCRKALETQLPVYPHTLRPHDPFPFSLSLHSHPQTLTFLPHASLAAFAKATLLALATHVGVHGAVAPAVADIACPFDDTAAEESLAALTAQHIVVEARGLVPTHTAQLVPQHFGGWPLFSLLWMELWIQRKALMFISKEKAWCSVRHCPEHSVPSFPSLYTA